MPISMSSEFGAMERGASARFQISIFPNHVRFFRTPEQVAARYSGLIDIRTVIKVTRPIMPDGRVSSYLRNLRWSRDDPSRFLGFLGVQTFDRLGGWFLLCGTKKQR